MILTFFIYGVNRMANDKPARACWVNPRGFGCLYFAIIGKIHITLIYTDIAANSRGGVKNEKTCRNPVLSLFCVFYFGPAGAGGG